MSLEGRGLASFSSSCRPSWLSFPHILKIAHMTSTRWTHQHFKLLRAFQLTPTTYNLLKAVEWSNKTFVGQGLQVYGLAMPLEGNHDHIRRGTHQAPSHWEPQWRYAQIHLPKNIQREVRAGSKNGSSHFPQKQQKQTDWPQWKHNKIATV